MGGFLYNPVYRSLCFVLTFRVNIAFGAVLCCMCRLGVLASANYNAVA
jgi:hypothetical protein